MAVFGAPRTRDDDAERAVRAALALVVAVVRLGATLGWDDLALRIGANSGEAVYGEATAERGPVTADTVNVAARLQAASDPGSVVIGEVTPLAVADVMSSSRAARLAAPPRPPLAVRARRSARAQRGYPRTSSADCRPAGPQVVRAALAARRDAGPRRCRDRETARHRAAVTSRARWGHGGSSARRARSTGPASAVPPTRTRAPSPSRS